MTCSCCCIDLRPGGALRLTDKRALSLTPEALSRAWNRAYRAREAAKCRPLTGGEKRSSFAPSRARSESTP